MTIRPDIAAPEAPTTVENADITVVGGAGHVGIPLVLALAEAGPARQRQRPQPADLETLQAGQTAVHRRRRGKPLLAKALAGKRLVFTSAPDRDLDRRPGDHHHRHAGRRVPQPGAPASVQAASTHCCRDIADGQLAGAALDGVSRHHRLARRLSQARRAASCKVAFCPERVVQGYGIKELREMPQIVSGRHAGGGARKRPSCSSASRRKW